jgi:hypothetical protein
MNAGTEQAKALDPAATTNASKASSAGPELRLETLEVRLGDDVLRLQAPVAMRAGRLYVLWGPSGSGFVGIAGLKVADFRDECVAHSHRGFHELRTGTRCTYVSFRQVPQSVSEPIVFIVDDGEFVGKGAPSGHGGRECINFVALYAEHFFLALARAGEHQRVVALGEKVFEA